MQLIGMLDSPYVRRVAISLRLLGIPFEHRALSVFRSFDQFRAINPVVKAPTLVCDDGEVLMESTLILDYAEALAPPGKSLVPKETKALQHDLRLVGLALAACDKSVQIAYERLLRPKDKQHEPWVERVQGQTLAAYGELEAEIAKKAPALVESKMTQGGLTLAVAWRFSQHMVGDMVPAAKFPGLVAFSAAAEKLPAFIAAPLV
jgi:glutathione S-transferase